jgi:hypothetical protein
MLFATSLATAALLEPSATAAVSAAPTLTRIVMSATPATVSYTSPKVTVAGALETWPSSGSAQPIPGEPVDVVMTWQNGASSQDLGTFTTDAAGQFSVTATLPAPGAVHATFGGDATYAATRGVVVLDAAPQLPPRVSIEPIAPTPYNGLAAVTGLVTMQLPDGTWVPAPDVPIAPWACGGPDDYKVEWTDASGQFTATIVANPNDECSFYLRGDRWDSWVSPGDSGRVYVPLSTFPTRIPQFSPAAWANGRVPVNALDFVGLADYEDSTGLMQGYPNGPVQLYFAAGTSSTWTLMATTVTQADGGFQFPRVPGVLPNGKLAAGVWRAVTPQAGAYLAGGSEPYVAILAVPSFLRDVEVQHANGHRYLTGTLDYLAKADPLHGVRVVLQVDNIEHPGWRKLTVQATTAQGYFAFRLPADRAGLLYFRVRFAGGPIPGYLGDPRFADLYPAYSAAFRSR